MPDDQQLRFPYVWTYSPELWRQFLKIERKNKREDNIYTFIGAMILCVPGLMLMRGTSFLVALMFSLPMAIIFSFGRQWYVMSKMKGGLSKPEVRIEHDTLWYGNKKIPIFNKKRWIKDLRLIHHVSGMELLEFSIGWTTSKGPTFDEYRVPILEEHKADAELLIAYFQGKVPPPEA